MQFLKQHAKTYQKEIILAPLFKLLETTFELAIPLILANLVDDVIPSGRQETLISQILILFAFAFFGVLMAIAAQFFSAKASVGISSQLSKDLFNKVLSLSQSECDKQSASQLINTITNDTLQLQTGINLFLRLFLRAPIIVFGSLIMAFKINVRLSLLFVGMIAILFLLVFGINSVLKPINDEIRHLMDRMVSQTREQMQGMRVIRAFNKRLDELNDFEVTNTQLFHHQVKSNLTSTYLTPLTFLVVNATLIILLWQGHSLVVSSVLSPGAIIALINYLLQILVELLKTTVLLQSLNQAYISGQRIEKVLSLSKENEFKLISHEQEQSYSMIVDKLCFTYPNASSTSLKNISLKLLKGENLGIIGGTGAGKTTFIKILSGLYSVDGDQFTLFSEGKVPKTITEWRDKVALVPQRSELFQGSIRENLTIGMGNNVSENDIWRALDIAQASAFVREREGQLDSSITAFGRSLSGGQRQRLAIARAILKKSPFLIFDDATSALDYLTESRLIEALLNDLPETTLIIVSQRTRVLEKLDKILVLEEGEQVGFGSHSYLLSHNPVYKAIYDSQLSLEGGLDNV